MLVIPALWWVYWINHYWIPDPPTASILPIWQSKLVGANADAKSAVRMIYEDTSSRRIALEAKAVGMLTAVAILAAADSVACTGDPAPAAFGIASLIFVTFAGWACCWVLIPRGRTVITLGDIFSSTSGVAEMAAASELAHPHSQRAANMITSANYDLIRALLLTIVALTTFVWLRPVSPGTTPCPRTTTTTSTTTTSKPVISKPGVTLPSRAGEP